MATELKHNIISASTIILHNVIYLLSTVTVVAVMTKMGDPRGADDLKYETNCVCNGCIYTERGRGTGHGGRGQKRMEEMSKREKFSPMM